MYGSHEPFRGAGDEQPSESGESGFGGAARPSQQCAQIEPLLEAFHDGALDSVHSRTVAEHLATCAHCAAHLERYAQVDALVRAAPAPRAGPELRRRLEQRITAAQRRQRTMAPHAPMHNSSEKQMRPTDSMPPSATVMRSSHTPRRLNVWLSGLAAAVIVAMLAGVFLALAHSKSSPTVLHGTSTSPAGNPVIPAGPWQAAYLGADGHVHLVSANGKNVTGPALPQPELISQSLPLANASISPDGHLLAYTAGSDVNNGGNVTILNLATSKLTTTSAQALAIYWSPDGTKLAAQGTLDSGSFSLVNAKTGAVTHINVTLDGQPAGIGRLLGWTNASHIAAVASISPAVSGSLPATTPIPTTPTPTKNSTRLSASLSGGPANFVGVVDLKTGAAHNYDDLATPPDVFLSPDGQEALVAANYWNSSATLVNLASEQVTSLPKITNAFAGKLVNMDNLNLAQGGNYSAHFAWKPGTHILAVSLTAAGLGPEGSTGPATQPAGAWLLNLDRDTATQITHNSYPLAWTPDGSTLLLSSVPQSDTNGSYPHGGGGVGPTLYALSPVAASSTPKKLASGMTAFFGLAVS